MPLASTSWWQQLRHISNKSPGLRLCNLSLLLGQVLAQWEKVSAAERWTPEWGLQALAAADRAQLSLGAYMDTIYGLAQPHAERFGDACGIDQAYIANFGEEVVRGQPAFVLSILLRWLAPMLRATAGVGSWQVASIPPRRSSHA